jgi:mannose-6-phosphate isomerase-like protein (cupin superfamily)
MAGGVLTNPMTNERFVRMPAPFDRLRIEVQAPLHMVRPPLHLHCHSAESFQIIEGSATVLVDGTERVLREGDVLEVVPGTPHTWWNSGDGLLRFLTESLRMQTSSRRCVGWRPKAASPTCCRLPRRRRSGTPISRAPLSWCNARSSRSFGRWPGGAVTEPPMRASTARSMRRLRRRIILCSRPKRSRRRGVLLRGAGGAGGAAPFGAKRLATSRTCIKVATP